MAQIQRALPLWQLAFSPWRWPKRAWLIFAPGLFLSYILCEAPLVRFEQSLDGRLRLPSTYRQAKPVLFYPAHRIFDYTPLYWPLVKWARLWGVDYGMVADHAQRTGFVDKINSYRIPPSR